MKAIEFSNDEKQQLVKKVQVYFNSELNDEIGQFDAEFLIDFFSENLGGHYYNRGLQDAQLVIHSKLDDIEAEIDSLEKPMEYIT